MIDDEKRARWLATWASMGLEAADYLRDNGQESDGADLERTIWGVVDLAGEEIGDHVISMALQEVNDLWCDGQSLEDDFFAGDWLPSDRWVH